MPDTKTPRKRVHIQQDTYNEASLLAKLNGFSSVDELFEFAFNQWLDMTSGDPEEVLNPPGPNDPVEMTIRVAYDTKKFLEEITKRSGHTAGKILERSFKKHVEGNNKKQMEAAKPSSYKMPLKTYDA